MGDALAGAAHDGLLLLAVTPCAVLLAAATLQQVRALQVILAAVTAQYLLVAIGGEHVELRNLDMVITIASVLAGIVGLQHRPWLKEPGTTAAARASQPPQQCGRLSQRQRTVLDLALQGMTSGDIGARLGISARTVEYHRYKAYKQLGVHSIAEVDHSVTGAWISHSSSVQARLRSWLLWRDSREAPLDGTRDSLVANERTAHRTRLS